MIYCILRIVKTNPDQPRFTHLNPPQAHLVARREEKGNIALSLNVIRKYRESWCVDLPEYFFWVMKNTSFHFGDMSVYQKYCCHIRPQAHGPNELRRLSIGNGRFQVRFWWDRSLVVALEIILRFGPTKSFHEGSSSHLCHMILKSKSEDIFSFHPSVEIENGRDEGARLPGRISLISEDC